MSALESSLSVKLLNRSTRKLSLTEAGALFYEHCARIVKEAELAEERMTRAQSEPAGLVKVTAVPAFATRYLVAALAEFHERYPKIRVELSCSNRRSADLGDEGFDLGHPDRLRALDPKLVTRKLAPNRACSALHRRTWIAAGRRADPTTFASTSTSCSRRPRRRVRGRSGAAGASIRSTFAPRSRPTTSEAVRAAVVAGMGIGILPLYMTSDALQQGRLVPLLRDYEVAAESAIYLVYLPNRTLPSRVRALIDFLVGRFAPIPPWDQVVPAVSFRPPHGTHANHSDEATMKRSGAKQEGESASQLISREDRRARRLARRDARPDPRSDQGGRPRHPRGVEVDGDPGSGRTTGSSAPARPTRTS